MTDRRARQRADVLVRVQDADYTAEDLGGHVWTFSQSVADVDPASWGGTLR